ncbi:hypothetical protein EIP91_011730 [Steccherinum ochraceum]|uniref:ATP-dependent DNA ligase family profile domain-containing protein n=1 Tax=Steccherinum ochraceum TaxID=92696 RepID=A0A4R0RVI6_9APHY|nr:hypothetical protein EIP91_011730 [Steccherinum ochraceum]
MSKRQSSGSASASPLKKKVKSDPNQANLDAFFRRSARPDDLKELPSNGKAKESFSARSNAPLRSAEPFNTPLADPNGLQIAESSAQSFEAGSESLNLGGPRQSVTGASTASAQFEVIDVDLLDDDEPQMGPSGSKGEGTSGRSYRSTPSSTTPVSPARPGPAAPAFLCNVGPTDTVTYRSLTVDPPLYDLEVVPWFDGAHAPYSFLAHTLSTLSQTRSRIVISNTLTNSLRTIIKYHPASLLPALYLLSNSLSPPYSPLELGLGPSVISKAIQHVSGLTSVALKRLYNATGDPGDVAFEAKSNVRTLIPHPPLVVTGVYDSLLKIANAKGQGAAKQKQSIVEKLLVAAKGEETRYLVRTLCMNLRVGAVRTSILTALARAMVLTPPTTLINTPTPQSLFYASTKLIRTIKPPPPDIKKAVTDQSREELNAKYITAEALIKKVYVQRPNYDQIVPALLEYPDIISLVKHIFDTSPQTTSFIFDTEIVAIDPADGSLKSFQELSNRARRDVRIDDVKVTVCVFAFDIMYLDGQILLQQPFRERRQLLRSRFPPITPQEVTMARFDHVQSCESESGREALEEFWELALNNRTEGLMIKLLDSGDILEDPKSKKDKTRRKPLPATYEPDKRTSAWLKLKKDYVTGLGDSLDLVPIGAWHGNGRKAQYVAEPFILLDPSCRLTEDGLKSSHRWWSPILLALWDPDAGKLVAVCKCMSGFTDVFYKDLRERYPENSETCSREARWDYECETGGLRPEVYFKPQEVWEIRGADITISPVSVAALGLVSAARGLSLRFPRFIKVRDDKGIENASTPEFLAKMWKTQEAQGKDHTGVDDGDLMDVLEESDVVEEELSEGD